MRESAVLSAITDDQFKVVEQTVQAALSSKENGTFYFIPDSRKLAVMKSIADEWNKVNRNSILKPVLLASGITGLTICAGCWIYKKIKISKKKED